MTSFYSRPARRPLAGLHAQRQSRWTTQWRSTTRTDDIAPSTDAAANTSDQSQIRIFVRLRISKLENVRTGFRVGVGAGTSKTSVELRLRISTWINGPTAPKKKCASTGVLFILENGLHIYTSIPLYPKPVNVCIFLSNWREQASYYINYYIFTRQQSAQFLSMPP